MKVTTIRRADAEGKDEFVADFRMYETLEGMRRGMKRFVGHSNVNLARRSSGVDGALAYTVCKKSSHSKRPTLAILFFNKEHIGAGVAAHELTHLLLWVEEEMLRQLAGCKRWSRKKHDLQEAIAESMENMTRMFWEWWYDKVEKEA